LRGGLALPEFRGENAGELVPVRDLDEARLGERGGVVREAGGAEACKDAEGEVEAADEELCREMHEAGRNAEVGDEPEGSGCDVFCDAVDEVVEFGLREAVEKEVSDDQVVGVVWVFERKGESVGVVRVETGVCVWSCCLATFAKQLKHGDAGVDGIGTKVRIFCKELSEEATVSVTDDQRVAAIEELREIVSATVF
jgi:hypothetical protein